MDSLGYTVPVSIRGFAGGGGVVAFSGAFEWSFPALQAKIPKQKQPKKRYMNLCMDMIG
jgi:hypothetical protein